MGSAVAAVAVNGEEAALLGNMNFEEKVAELASHYGISSDLARRYVFDHEFVHVSQKGKYGKDHVAAEADVEGTLMEFYKEMAKADPAKASEYSALGKIASDRAGHVASNYSKLGSYGAPKSTASTYAGKAGYVGKAASSSSYAGKAAA